MTSTGFTSTATAPVCRRTFEAVSLICGLVSVAGIVLMVCGVLNFLTRKRRAAAAANQ